MVEELGGVCVDVICSATSKSVQRFQVLLIFAAVAVVGTKRGFFCSCLGKRLLRVKTVADLASVIHACGHFCLQLLQWSVCVGFNSKSFGTV